MDFATGGSADVPGRPQDAPRSPQKKTDHPDCIISARSIITISTVTIAPSAAKKQHRRVPAMPLCIILTPNRLAEDVRRFGPPCCDRRRDDRRDP
jgi:hypothetical protein